jgi:hypothetical protein
MKWTEGLVLDVLRETYLAADPQTLLDEWALLTHVPLRDPEAAGNERIIDALAVRCWSSGKGHQRIAFEVKVSRPDFRNETPEKRAPAEASAHLCTYVAPAGLLRPDEMPPGWGLVEVYEEPASRARALGMRAVWAKRPTNRTPTCDLDYLVSAGFRRASRAEEKIRTGEVPAAEYARMQQELTSLDGITRRAQATARREAARANAARGELLAASGPLECADCGAAVTWKRGGALDMQWTHVDPAHERACLADRKEKDRRRREAETGAEYAWGMAGPIEPIQIREQRLAEERENEAQEAAS